MAPTVELSRREREVAALVADGLSNREIAQRLFISERTAEGHVEQILNKLGFVKRAQVAAWVAGGRGDRQASSTSTVPRPLTPLVGRSAEIDAVIKALRTGRLVTVTGAGGIGKTRVALEAAARLEGGFRDGAWFVELDSVADNGSVPGAVALALKIPQTGAEAVESRLGAHLARREALLIFDNCEHVVDSCRQLLRAVLSHSSGVRVLATSRERLGLPGERVVGLDPLAIGTDAVELFTQRCHDLGTSAAVESDVGLVTSICERLDGIPLAIELAAAQTPVLPLAAIAQRLDDRFRTLRDEAHAPSPRHRALEAAVDWSYQLLPADEAAAYRMLSVFRGGFDLDAAEAVLGDEPQARPPLDLVAALIRKSMVVPRDERSGERRYHMLETLREFAARRLEPAAESTSARDRHANFYLELGSTAFDRMRTADSDRWVRRLDLERGNLAAALEFLAATKDARFPRLVSALGRYWIRGRVQDGYRWADRAMRATDPNADPDLNLLEAWAWLTWQGSRSGPAFDALDLMLDAALRAKNDAMAGRALNMIATFRNDEKLPVDPQLWRRAESHLRKAHDDWMLALLLNDIGFITSVHGKPAEGLPKILEGLKLARRAGDGWLIALILDSAAWAYADMGEIEQAVSAWAEGISMTVAAADRYPLPNYLEGFARVARIEADPNRACVLLAAAAGVRDGIGARPLESWTDYLRQDVDIVRAALGEEEFEARWRGGVAMSAEEAVRLALARVESGATSVPDSPPLEVSGS